ncbi:hypothetical protein GCM10023224_40750 [Streptomonospora halophila]|uniref:Fibronectin type-III domain-containing protein n=1 Tax=Streptomonospora halophila TaxID=427369 RepID=A0ABP9GVP2_9ACTN
MPVDRETSRAIDRLARELANMQRDMDALKRGQRRPQLANSSTTGTLTFMDPETEEVRLRIGRTADGFGLITEGGDPPTAPTAPTVAPAPLGLMVSWDGELATEVALGPEFDHVNVYVADTDDFAAATLAGTIPRAGGVAPIVPLEVAQTYHVWLVGVTTGGVSGDPSASVSGVPEGVGGVPEPGSITETMIADDAISTPKIQAEAVAAANIAANAINAGHIVAGAIDASKLAATLVLASTIIAGTPGAARCEMGPTGLRVYDASDVLIGAFEGGSIAITGTITGSEILGSSFRIDGPGGHIRIGPSLVNPDLLDISVVGGGSSIVLSSRDVAAVELTPPPGTTEDYHAGLIWAFVIEGDTWSTPAVVHTSPKGTATLPSAAQAEAVYEGGSDTVNAARVRLRGDVIQFSQAGFTQYQNGVVQVDPELTIRAPAHAPVRTDMETQPDFTGTSGDWHAVGSANMPDLPFVAPMSGRVRVVVTACGANTNSSASSLALGFQILDDTATLVIHPHLRRCYYVSGTTGPIGHSRVIQIEGLIEGTEYVLQPMWRKSSGGNATCVFDTALENSVTVEPLM